MVSLILVILTFSRSIFLIASNIKDFEFWAIIMINLYHLSNIYDF